jgi:N-methylhydantoinase A
VLIPTIAVSSIGAGGGSIIWLDQTNSLKVGPRSVGADPGPACYGLKGSLVPALTDAFLVAGLLAPGQRLGGKLPLQMEPARRALDTIATPLGWSVEDVADGAIRVATALMTAEASNVLARRGVDAPRFRMVAFGGAGPLVAALLAEEISIDSILVPPRPGALSALGAARADVEGDIVLPIYELLGKLPNRRLADELHKLEAQAHAWIAEQTATLPVAATRIEIAADMRYDGQGYDVTVPLQSTWLADNDAEKIAGAFHDAHRATYGHAAEQAEVWLKELRAHIVGVLPKPRILPIESRPEPGLPSRRQVRLFGRSFEAAVLERDSLASGRRIEGPAIIDQMDTTTLIPAGWHGSTVASGALIVERSAARSAAKEE